MGYDIITTLMQQEQRRLNDKKKYQIKTWWGNRKSLEKKGQSLLIDNMADNKPQYPKGGWYGVF